MTGVLPSYQRFVNGVPVPSFSRRSFRLREKYLILSVLFTFGIIWLGALFYLPEYKTSSSSVNDSVYNVYKQIQKAGPELLIPAPPVEEHVADIPLHKHGEEKDIHVVQDRNRFMMKVDEDMSLKVLEKPQFVPAIPSSSKGPKISENVGDAPAANPVESKEAPLEVPYDKNELSEVRIKETGADPDPEVRNKRDTVRKMMKHAWGNYKLYAWGKNELKPMSKRAHLASVFGASDLGASIVDGLDTLYIMGMQDEFNDGRDWVANSFNFNAIDADLSVFETTIRFVGGFLSCYALTGDTVFRDKAVQVANALLPAFDTPTGLPYALINPNTMAKRQYMWAGAHSILSEVGTLHMEFVYLSDVTGNPIYRQKVQKIREILNNAEKPSGLYPNYINPRTGQWGQQFVSMGALGDSFYEYLLKAWLMSNKRDTQAIEMYEDAMDAVLAKLLRTSPGGLTYLTELKHGRVYEEKMDHLACFSGGMLALGASAHESDTSPEHMDVAKRLTHTCHESYARSDTKLGPEAFRFSGSAEARAMKSNEKVYLLRPETFESYFILWRLTKDQKYRDWGWEAVQALEKHCRTDGGYNGIMNVYHEHPVGDDVQQSYFLAETLKYLYLLFSDDSLLPLDQWVFNTEAHPLPIHGVNPKYRLFEEKVVDNNILQNNQLKNDYVQAF